MRLGAFSAKKVIYINAGHFKGDPGASCCPASSTLVERDEVMKIRDAAVKYLLIAGFDVKIVPDDLNLTNSVAFVNQTAKTENDGVALDIHLNNSKYGVRGTEVYSGDSVQEKSQAGILSETLSKTIGVPNRGYKSQTQSYLGSLMWINQVKCWSHIIECLYISSDEDRKALNHDKVGQGIALAACKLFGFDIFFDDSPVILSMKQTILELQAKLVELLTKLLAKLR